MTQDGPAPDAAPRMRVREVPRCPLCESEGRIAFSGLADRFRPGPQAWTFRRCDGRCCGLLWLDPVPLEADAHLAYHPGYYTHRDETPARTWYRRGFAWLRQGYLARRYGYRRARVRSLQRLAGAAVWLFPRRRAETDASVLHLRAEPAGRLLEIGCGGGAQLQLMADLGWRVVGVDTDRLAVDRARSKGLVVHEGELERLRLEAGYDAVAMSHVVEHVPDPLALLRECTRLLRPGGTLVVVTPNADGLCTRVFGGSSFTLEAPRHRVLFNRVNLRQLAVTCGLEVRVLRTRSRHAGNYWRLSREIRRRGRVDLSRPATRAEMLGALAYETLQAALLTVARGLGDEILLIARRP